MDFKAQINAALDKAYTKADSVLNNVFTALEMVVDDVFPDSPAEVSMETKRNDLAVICEAADQHEAAAKWRDPAQTPDNAVTFIWKIIPADRKSKPQAATKADNGIPNPGDKEAYLKYLQKNFPSLAKMWAQLHNLETEDRLHDVESDDDDDDEGTGDNDPFGWLKDK